jgi:hypothetical protein
MHRQLLIESIFEATPETQKGYNHSGQRVVELSHKKRSMYATLEKLPDVQLHVLSRMSEQYVDLAEFFRVF